MTEANPKYGTRSKLRKQKTKECFRESLGEYGDARKFDLEDRTFEFARRVRAFVKRLQQTIANVEDSRQLVNSSGSTGANYIEANEALSMKDFVVRIKISRKEAKESRFWLRLVDTGQDAALEKERAALVQEAQELTSIFGSILRKSE